QRLAHRPERGPQDVHPVDTFPTRDRDGNNAALNNPDVERLSFGACQGLRIIESFRELPALEHDSGDHHRPGEGPAADLVDPRYPFGAAPPRAPFEKVR